MIENQRIDFLIQQLKNLNLGQINTKFEHRKLP